MREPEEGRGKAEGKVDDSRLSAVIMATERRKNKLGKMINSSWLGRPYQRRMPETVANPRTEAQQAHRVAFGEVSRLSSAMREAHEEGLHWHAVRERLNTSSVFKKYNKGCYGADGIDYARVIISRGSVSEVKAKVVEIDVQGNVHVEFHDQYPTDKNQHDRFFLYVFCPDLREGHFAEPVERTVGVVDARIPEEWLGHELHLYAFMKEKKGRTSDTMYLGLFKTSEA